MERQVSAQDQVAVRPYTLQLRSVRVARIRIEPTARIPVGDKFQYTVEMTVEGVFHSRATETPMSEEELMRFKGRDATVVLWPYLRSYLSDSLSRMGLSGVPPLPLIDPRALVEESHGKERKGRKTRPEAGA